MLIYEKKTGDASAPSIPGPVLDFWPDVVLNIQHRAEDQNRAGRARQRKLHGSFSLYIRMGTKEAVGRVAF